MNSENEPIEEKRFNNTELDSIALETAKVWSQLTPEEIAATVAKGDFIIDIYRRRNLFDGIELQGEWAIGTTSRSVELPGTIFIEPKGDKEKAIFDAALTKHLEERGLSASQITLFKELNFHGKFKILPYIATILNNSRLFRAFRAYKRDMTNKEYHEWRAKHKMHNEGLNGSLYRGDRFMIAEFLKNVCSHMARKKREANNEPA